MNQELLIEQTKVEGRALEHVTRALEVMLGWDVDPDGFTRKLLSVRFFTELYHRHLERLFALEEVDGYMESVARLNPRLNGQVEALHQQHEVFRIAIRRLGVRLELASPTDFADFEATCSDLRKTINQILEHLRREQELLVESFNRDTGGEA
jgi:hypothetical protein